jgi:uncharacterized SAM-binding protein YcdF (DUF218 family)
MATGLGNRLRNALAFLGLLTLLVHADGVLSLGAYWRTVYALNVWRTGKIRHILLSGGGDFAPQAAEAVVARTFLISNGVPAGAITVKTASMSTHDNALLSAPLAAGLPGRKLLLTSDFHMLRAIRAYRKAGIACEPFPIPDIRKRSLFSWRDRGSAFLELGMETVKIVYYATHGWI